MSFVAESMYGKTRNYALKKYIINYVLFMKIIRDYMRIRDLISFSFPFF